MDAGKIMMKEIKEVPDMYKFGKRLEDAEATLDKSYELMNSKYAVYEKAKRKYNRELKKLDKEYDYFSRNNGDYATKRDTITAPYRKSINDFNEQRELWVKDRDVLENIKKEAFKPTSKLVTEKLAELRAMGNGSLDVNGHLNNARTPARKSIVDAYDVYPNDWVKLSTEMGRISPSTADRGYYNHGLSKLVLSGDGDGSTFATAIHELGHRFERAVPNIRHAEQEFYEYRTKGEELAWMGNGYRKDEVTRVDNFIDKYMGKDYDGRAYELVSMGFQYAFTEPQKLMKDEEFAEWIYGILALF